MQRDSLRNHRFCLILYICFAMRWNEIKKDETLNSQFNKLKDIIFAYFKGTIKDKIGHNSNDDLVEKFPLEYTNAKISLLIEIFRRTVQEDVNEKFPVLNDYVYQEGILSDDEMAFLSEPTCFHIMAEYVLDTTSIPEHNLYPLPENLADYLLTKEREIFDVNRVLIINSGLGELVSSRVLWNKNEGTEFKNTNDSISVLNQYDVESVVDFYDDDLLGFALTTIRKEAKKLAFASNGHIMDEKVYKPFIDSDIFNYDTIVYFSNKLEKGKNDMLFAGIYEKMKPNSHLVMIVNRDWILYPYTQKETDNGFGKMYKDRSIVSVTELPKGIWHQTERATYIVVACKPTEKSDGNNVLFVDANTCKTKMKEYSLDYAKLYSCSVGFNKKDRYGYDMSTAFWIGWEQIAKEDGYLLPVFYIKVEDELISNQWEEFDSACKKCEFKGSAFAPSVIHSTFLYLACHDLIYLVEKQEAEEMDFNPNQWVEYLVLKNEDFDNTAEDDIIMKVFQTSSIFISNSVESSMRFIYNVLIDVQENCNNLDIYYFLAFITKMFSYNGTTNYGLCNDAFRHLCPWIHHIINDYGLHELYEAIIGSSNSSKFFPYLEFASEEDYALLPYEESDLYKEYCMSKLIMLWQGKSSFEAYVDPLKRGANEKVYASPMIGATYQDSNGKTRPMDSWIIREGLDCLSDTGLFASVFPASILTRSNKEYFELRKNLTDKNLLDQVILLPKGIMEHTNIAVCMILLRKGRDESDPIMLVNASNCSTEKWNHLAIDVNRVTELINTKSDDYVTVTNVQNIVENGYTWSPLHFWSNEIEVPEGYSSVRFDEIATQIKGTRAGKNEKASVIQIADLRTSPFDYDFKPSSIKFLLSFWTKRIAKIKEPVLLLSSVRGLRPTFCNASKSSPIYVDPSVYAFKINTDKVSLPYLMYYLSWVDQALNEGSTVPRNSLLSINSLKIVYPESLSAQKIAVEEGKKAYIQKKIEESGLKAEIERMKTEYINEVRMRKHDMKTPLAQLVNSFTLIDKFLDRIQGNKEEVDNIRIFLGRQKVALDNLQGQLQRLSDEDVYGNPERFNLEDALRHIVPSSNRYTVNYRRDNIAFNEAEIETAFVKMNPANFTSIVNNILDNALRHGFVDDTRSDYRVDITLTIEDNMYVVTFANNGVPFPKGLNAERYGIKGESAGKNAGTGIGGYRIKSISEHFGGMFSLKTTRQKEEILSNVIIKLPILFDDEEV